MKRHYTDAEKRRGNVARGLIDLPPSGVMWGGRGGGGEGGGLGGERWRRGRKKEEGRKEGKRIKRGRGEEREKEG